MVSAVFGLVAVLSFLALQGVLDGYHRAMNEVFERYGSFAARRPTVPLIIGLVLLGGISFGLFNVKKEADLEKLWVEQNSRVVEEKEFFDSRFGGISRLEAVTITPRDGKDYNLVHAMDALKSSITPLYDNLTMTRTINGKTYNFRENDFCERPVVPDYIKSGTDPLKNKNFISWGYSKYANCALEALNAPPELRLPDGWGIDWLPCLKLSALDCFKEGGDFDYPPALKLLEQEAVSGLRIAQIAVIPNGNCQTEVRSNYTALNIDENTVNELVQGVTGLSRLLLTWGYSWRKSYAGMTNQQVLDHINAALRFGKSADPNPTNPQIVDCLSGTQPCCMTWFGAHSPTLTSLGSLKYDASGNITEIKGLRWAGNNFHQRHPVWESYISNLLGTSFQEKQREQLTKDWEAHMINELDPLRQHQPSTIFGDKNIYGDLQLEFNMWRSSEDIISDANKTPVWQIVLSGILVSIYSFLAFVNFKDPVHSFTWLALTGMVVVSLAVIAGFGFSAAVGIKLTPLAGSVVPFLTLGLGIDDVFVLVSVLRNYLKDPSLKDITSKVPEAEMRMTTALAGPSVVLTTFSVLASFFISSLSPMPIVRWFCWQMGITATLHTLGMLLIFIPIMAIDARRVKANVCDPYLWLLCGIRKKENLEGPLASKDSPGNFSGHVTGTSFVSRAVAKYYAPLFENNLFKVVVLVLFSALLAVTTYLGFEKVEHGLLLSDITLKGSYQNTFAVVTEGKFLSYQINYVTRDIDFARNQENLLKIYETMQSNLSYWTPPQPRVLEASVLGNIMVYTANSRPDIKTVPVNVSGIPLFTIPVDVFDQTQQAWSSTPIGIFSLPDYYCEDKTTKEHLDCFTTTFKPNLRVAATKTSIFIEHLGAETEPNLRMIRQTRKIADQMNAEIGENVGYVYGYPFLFFEQYLHSSRNLYIVVGFALLGVFVAVLIFQFSIVISVLIVIVLLMVDLEVYGFIYVIGAKLNSLSLVNLGIVIGMAAELTYLARAFLMVEGTRNYRVGKALEWTLEPLLHGFGTQVVATLPLVFLKYHAFRIYYFAMFAVMGVLSFLNGFVLLPVLLSWFGPPALPSHIPVASTHSFSHVDEDQKGDKEMVETEPAQDMDLRP
ncbi:protein patched homolog 2 isoform X1 [Selaginella moellendorffii]|uniref:protein patched homolog 2 isoform X1 n=1 Tax=Selaginella moellendorffii TaxID=88036 RepID=UPI000D1CAC65|nr:protein patched homolog 2 isoform X1 [Selaginella moellendorffii]|eukprot:XP_024533742.1 protein patched homolog 2 isoform X1 [Selaginella moellendorffii]